MAGFRCGAHVCLFVNIPGLIQLATQMATLMYNENNKNIINRILVAVSCDAALVLRE